MAGGRRPAAWRWWRWWRLVAMVAMVAGGCGGSGGSPPAASRSTSSGASRSGSATATTTSSRARPRRPRPHGPHGAPVGATQQVHAGSSTLAVTVTRLLDPLTGTGSAVLPGTRPIGVMVAIHHLAGATYDSTASGDWSLVTSAGRAAPLFVRRGACQTPLVDFESLIGAGEIRTGCVGFSAARGARVAEIRFSPHSRAAGAVSWR